MRERGPDAAECENDHPRAWRPAPGRVGQVTRTGQTRLHRPVRSPAGWTRARTNGC
jgi:hypothetical protein